MIELLESRNNVYTWRIDGIEVAFGWCKQVDRSDYNKYIAEYRAMLKEKDYLISRAAILKSFNVLGCIPFFRIGLTAFYEDFSEMYRHFARAYFLKLFERPVRCLSPVSYTHLIGFMLYGQSKCKENHGKWLIQSPTNDLRALLLEMTDTECAAVSRKMIAQNLWLHQNLKEVADRIGVMTLTGICMDYEYALTEKAMRGIAADFTAKREFISMRLMIKRLTGDLRLYSAGCDERFKNLMENIIGDEVRIQKELFPTGNRLEMDAHKDLWRIYRPRGGSLTLKRYDFTVIESASLRYEVKYYMIYRVSRGQSINLTLANGLNALCDLNPNIKYSSDITEEDARALFLFLEREYRNKQGDKLTISTIRYIFSLCSGLLEYLMSQDRSNEIKSPRPYHNPFMRYRFPNLDAHKEKTAIIPESVAEEIDRHIGELDSQYALAYKIFSNTGMRLKEIQFLEVDCLESSKYENVKQLRYIPYKTLLARRKRGLEDCHRVLIPFDLAQEIIEFSKTTAKYRLESGLPYIFLSTQRKGKISMLSIGNLSNALNKLIRKHQINDENGDPWNFTTKQCRKTLAVTLIENGATTAELAYWLGHLSNNTSKKYYAEVRKMKLAELNTDFFRNKFDLMLSEQQIAVFSEEERKLLYIDFRLERRRVEYGYCLLHPTDGECTKHYSLYNCANCPHLCTGPQYFQYWRELLDSQLAYLEELQRTYAREGIENCHSYKEYQQAEFLVRCYQCVVSRIQEGGDHQ